MVIFVRFFAPKSFKICMIFCRKWPYWGWKMVQPFMKYSLLPSWIRSFFNSKNDTKNRAPRAKPKFRGQRASLGPASVSRGKWPIWVGKAIKTKMVKNWPEFCPFSRGKQAKEATLGPAANSEGKSTFRCSKSLKPKNSKKYHSFVLFYRQKGGTISGPKGVDPLHEANKN